MQLPAEIDGHDFHKHTPKLFIHNPEDFQIIKVISKGDPTDYHLSSWDNHTKIYFSYDGNIYMLTDRKERSHIFYGRNIELYKKTENNLELLDGVFDSNTHLHQLKDQKNNLLLRLTDIWLIGGCMEETVRRIHQELDDLEEKKEKLLSQLYPGQ